MRLSVLFALVVFVFLALAADAKAFGRRCRGQSCPAACQPAACQPCHQAPAYLPVHAAQPVVYYSPPAQSCPGGVCRPAAPQYQYPPLFSPGGCPGGKCSR